MFGTNKKRNVIIVIAALSLVALVVSVIDKKAPDIAEPATSSNSASVSAGAANQKRSEEPEEVVKAYGPGTLKVGVDIPEGDYKVFQDKDRVAYYSVNRDSAGSSVLFNDSFYNFSYVTVSDGQYLSLLGCYAVAVADVPVVDNGAPYGPGTLKVGADLPAGEYKMIAQSDFCYYAVYNDRAGGTVIFNDAFENISYATLQEGQYISMQNCYAEPVE